MTGVIALISFFCTALIEVINTIYLNIIPEDQIIPLSHIIPLIILEFIFLSIALIASVKGLLFKDSTSKKLKFLYVVASVIWLSEKVFETLFFLQ
tara:strand:+ start:502 stop:786 length:285 start_codon:yes stop_codon:yes gene_type:complete